MQDLCFSVEKNSVLENSLVSNITSKANEIIREKLKDYKLDKNSLEDVRLKGFDGFELFAGVDKFEQNGAGTVVFDANHFKVLMNSPNGMIVQTKWQASDLKIKYHKYNTAVEEDNGATDEIIEITNFNFNSQDFAFASSAVFTYSEPGKSINKWYIQDDSER